jgi:hypothetical protein
VGNPQNENSTAGDVKANPSGVGGAASHFSKTARSGAPPFPSLPTSEHRRAILARSRRRPPAVSDSPESTIKVIDTHSFWINQLSPDDKKILLTLFQKNQNLKVVEEFPSNLRVVQRPEADTWENLAKLYSYYPDVVEDLNGRKYFILHPDRYLPEPASMLALSYCLGMLSRYFPDVWMGVLDKRIEIVELANTFLNVLHRKFPHLILDQMTGVKHNIHS